MRNRIHTYIALALFGALGATFFSPGTTIAKNEGNPTGVSLGGIVMQLVEAEISVEELQIKHKNIESDESLNAADKSEALDIIDRAIYYLKRTEAFERRVKEIDLALQIAPERIEEIKKELDRPLPKTDGISDEANRMTTEQIEQRLRQEQLQFSSANMAANNWDNKLEALITNASQVRRLVLTAQQRQNELRLVMDEKPDPDLPVLLMEAKRDVYIAEKIKLQAEIEAYEKGLIGYDILVSLITAELDLALREANWRETYADGWESAIAKRRTEDIQRLLADDEKTDLGISSLPEILRQEAEKNIRISEQLETQNEEQNRLLPDIQAAKRLIKVLTDAKKTIRKRLEITVLSETIGVVLREEQRSLPDPNVYLQRTDKRRVKLNEIQLSQLTLENEIQELSDPGIQASQIMKGVPFSSEKVARKIEKKLENLLAIQKVLLDKLRSSNNLYFEELQSLDFLEQQIISMTNEYAQFLDKSLIWIRSSSILFWDDIKKLPAALSWLFSRYHWSQVISDLLAALAHAPLAALLGTIFTVILFSLRGMVRRSLDDASLYVGSIQKDSIWLTNRSIVATIWLALPWPFIVGFLGWMLNGYPQAGEFSHDIGFGFFSASSELLLITLIYHFCQTKGVAQVHFNWGVSTCQVLQRTILRFGLIIFLCVFIITATEHGSNTIHMDTLGRIMFILKMLVFSLIAFKIVRHFSKRSPSAPTSYYMEGWIFKTRYVWFYTVTGMAFSLALLAVLGYYYSAMAFELPVGQTINMSLLLLVINGTLLRGLLIERRKLVFEEISRKKQQAALKKAAEEKQPAEELVTDEVIIEEPSISISKIEEQYRTLLRSIIIFSLIIALWLIWSPLLPALNIFSDIELWNYAVEIDEKTIMMPINLIDLITAIVIIAITVIASRNLPGSLEIAILNRLKFDAGHRYAITTISRYIIITIGVIAASNAIGITWSSIKWLVAALGVGLGFGLQEIVANFICGIIILLERPYRVGDWVSIGDISGRVTQIHIRSTTVVDWDRRELIVPNKDFITGQLINWSLSDPITRLVIPVGIAYGSDTNLAEKLLLTAAKDNATVLEQPQPVALFQGFGDNSLEFELRTFINGAENRPRIRHQLHQAIDQAFRERGIEISFPQRDVHLDTDGPIEIRVTKPAE